MRPLSSPCPQALMTLVGVFLGWPKVAACFYLALALLLAWQYLRWVGHKNAYACTSHPGNMTSPLLAVCGGAPVPLCLRAPVLRPLPWPAWKPHM